MPLLRWGVRRKRTPRHLDLRLEAEPSLKLDGIPDAEKVQIVIRAPVDNLVDRCLSRVVQPLEIMFEHHLWATQFLIQHCKTLTAEQLEYSTPGTYGAIIPTITHLIAEDQRLLERLTGESAATSVTEEGAFRLEELEAVWEGEARRWREVIARVNELSVTLPARGKWPEVPHAEGLVLLEAIQHGNDHRTHVCSVLGANGLDVPFLCGWMFWRSTGRVGIVEQPAVNA